MARLQPSLFPEIEGPDFIRSEAIEKVGEAVLSKHGKVGGPLFAVAKAARAEEIRILWLRNDKPFDPEKDDEGHDAVGKCIKAPGLWHDVTGYDVAIWLRGWFFDKWTAEQREAFTLHELLHVEIKRDKDDQVKVGVAKHDVEDFVAVVKAYGTVVGDSARYVRAATVQPAPESSIACVGSNHVPGCEHTGGDVPKRGG
jgi:hypothetical protein